MPRTLALVGFAALALLLAACGDGASSAATATMPQATRSTGGSTPSGSQATRSTSMPGTPPVSGPVASASPSASPVPVIRPAGAIAFALDASRSEARYRVREQLASISAPSDAVGRTKSISGTVVFLPDGAIVREQSKITVDLRTLRSDESRRDNFIQGNTLQANRFPSAEFVPTELRGLSWPLPASGQATFELIGDLTIRGVTRPVTWQATADFSDGGLTGVATTSFKFADFGMSPPRVALVLSVDDNIRLELDFAWTREP